MKPKLSILITCYNKEKYISYILNQLIEQNSPEIEIHIIDDCSTDSSFNIIKEIAGSPDNFHIHHNYANLGISFVRNDAIKMVNGEYFIFIDGDDMLTENYVEKILSYIEQDSDSDVHTFKARTYPYGISVDLNCSLCNKIIKTAFLDKYKINFDGAIVALEDNYFLQEIDKQSPKYHHHKDVLYIYNMLVDDTESRQYGIWWNKPNDIDKKHFFDSL